ncbi:hypothetical protein [Alishewanella longhuensis]
MTNMFKKTLIAAAVLSVFGTAQAATLTATAQKVANERVATSATLTAADLHMTAGINYIDNDLVYITFSDDSIDSSKLKTVVNFYPRTVTNQAAIDAGAVAEPPVTVAPVYDYCEAAGGALESTAACTVLSARLNLLGANVVDGKLVVEYRISNASVDNSTINARTESFFSDTAGAIVANKLTGNLTAEFEAKAAGSGNFIDTAGGAARTATLVSLFNQFNTLEKATGKNDFTATIDVAKDRKEFVTAPTDIGFAVFAQRTGSPAAVVTFDQEVTVDKVTYTIDGNFGWALLTSGPNAGTLDTTRLNFACGGAPQTQTATAGQAVVSCANGEALTATVAIPNTVIIPTTPFSLSAKVEYTGVGALKGDKTLTLNGGSWSPNGSTVFIPYMLYGARNTPNQTINLINTGTQNGDITAEAIYDGKVYQLGKVAESSANSLTNVAPGIATAMANGVDGFPLLPNAGDADGRNWTVGLRLITNVKSEDVTVTSSYTLSGNRTIVVNDSNGKTADLTATNAAIQALEAKIDDALDAL